MCWDETPTILAVDDNKDNLNLLKEILNRQNYKIRLASNGAHALTTVKKEVPDLVLLDILMPGMDGFEVCKHLKADTLTHKIPVLFISALNEMRDIVKAFSVGGVDYVTKPFMADEILARVNTHLSLYFIQRQLEKKNTELNKALNEIKTLRGILPICASCKKIRNDEGYWEQIECYIRSHSEAEFSHGICNECAHKLYPELYRS